jgi:hypothetical protein
MAPNDPNNLNRGAGAYSTPGVDTPAGVPSTPIVTSAPEVKFKFVHVEPPGALYLTRDDLITIIITNSQPGVEVDLHYRQLLPDGSIHRGFMPFFPTSNRVFNFFSFTPGEGFMLSLSIGASPVSTKRGQTFVRVGLAYGTAGGGTTMGVLLTGYLSGRTNLVWPISPPDYAPNGPGFIRVITGTTPAAGAEINEVVPTGARWRVRAFTYNLTTSATVSNRETTLIFASSVTLFWNGSINLTQAASLNIRYSWGLATTLVHGSAQALHNSAVPEAIIAAGGSISTSTGNIQVGDQYSAPVYEVEEWIEE